MSTNISTEICKVKLKNPTVLASGILGSSVDILKRVAGTAGAVTLKSIGAEPKLGHSNPTVIEYAAGLLNAVGLPTPGIDEAKKELEGIGKIKAPVIVSIYGASVKEFVDVASIVAGYNPAMIELNISCPNSKKHGMQFGIDPDASHKIVSSVKNAVSNSANSKIPVMPKLTPNCDDIVKIAKACEDAGADAICAINSVGPGMIINIEARKPVLDYKKGGVTGPAIRPIAIRCVYDIYENVKIPVLGTGGVMTGRDLVEMMMAGASAVGIGSGVYYRGVDVFKLATGEMTEWMKENKVDTIKKFIGAAHE